MNCTRLYPAGLLLPALVFALFAFLTPSPAGAYSVLSHEEVVDMAWKDTIIPMLKARFPGITSDQILEAHAYAYGGSVIQDIGYYPFGSHYFSDLLHYVRPDAFVTALIRDSTTPDEYAFALGSLAHFCGDIIGHPAVNEVTSQENPKLQQKYGPVVTYAEDPTAHIRTEFGFDVVEVAQGHYSQQNYRDFIGFQVAKPLLEKAFLETYGMPMSSVIKHEDLAISTYRHAVSSIIPKMTVVAFVSYRDQIQAAEPGMEKRKFIYRLRETEYQKDFGTDYTHVGVRGRVLAFFIRLMPKVGPFRALKVNIPNPREQDVYLKSVNGTVDRFKLYLGEVHADPAPLPPPDPKTAEDARRAAGKVVKEAEKTQKAADKAQDPADKAAKEQIAANVNQAAAKVTGVAERAEANVAAAQANPGGVVPPLPGALAPDSPIAPPSTPELPELDLDTGRPSAAGEYKLADQTYAKLLDDLVKARPALQTPPSALPAAALSLVDSAPAAKTVDPAIAADIERFFAKVLPRTGPPPTRREARQEEALAVKIKADLAILRTMQPAN